MRVGTKELKNRLSHYLRLVREGEHVQVTDHGAVVAEIRAARDAANADEACLQALEQDGIVTIGKKRIADVAPVVVQTARGKKRLSAIVIAGRD